MPLCYHLKGIGNYFVNIIVNKFRKDGSCLTMKEIIKNIWNILTTIIVALVVLLAIALAGVRLIGIDVFAVLSGSMEPAYPVGSLIYVKDVDYRDLKAGDVITFMLSEDIVATHRIIEVVPDENDPETLRYRTKGDANNTEDGSLVHYKNVIGSPVFTIPKLGYFADYIQKPPGTYMAISVGAILLFLVFLPELFSSDEDKKKRKSGR
ncbi:MAG: signal peptidase I [Peptoniphilus sp.]|nr:signal peptidase I [Peptoniphilus sp.]